MNYEENQSTYQYEFSKLSARKITGKRPEQMIKVIEPNSDEDDSADEVFVA